MRAFALGFNSTCNRPGLQNTGGQNFYSVGYFLVFKHIYFDNKKQKTHNYVFQYCKKTQSNYLQIYIKVKYFNKDGNLCNVILLFM